MNCCRNHWDIWNKICCKMQELSWVSEQLDGYSRRWNYQQYNKLREAEISLAKDIENLEKELTTDHSAE